MIGIAGAPEKCVWLTEELGFDAALDYRQDGLTRRLRELTPDGVDVFFANVGGAVLDAGLTRLARGARVVLCGAISQYNSGAATLLKLFRGENIGKLVLQIAD